MYGPPPSSYEQKEDVSADSFTNELVDSPITVDDQPVGLAHPSQPTVEEK